MGFYNSSQKQSEAFKNGQTAPVKMEGKKETSDEELNVNKDDDFPKIKEDFQDEIPTVIETNHDNNHAGQRKKKVENQDSLSTPKEKDSEKDKPEEKSGLTSFKEFVLRSFNTNNATNDNLKLKVEKERITERKREKINAIIDAAVKRAILRNKLRAEASPAQQYDPLYNPVTGRPVGLIHKQTGHFLPVRRGGEGQGELSEGDKVAENSKEILSSTKNTTVLQPADVGRSEEENILVAQRESNSYPFQDVSSRKLDIDESRTQIDPSLDSLTREFLNIMQGEKSAINNPYYR